MSGPKSHISAIESLLKSSLMDSHLMVSLSNTHWVYSVNISHIFDSLWRILPKNFLRHTHTGVSAWNMNLSPPHILPVPGISQRFWLSLHTWLHFSYSCTSLRVYSMPIQLLKIRNYFPKWTLMKWECIILQWLTLKIADGKC